MITDFQIGLVVLGIAATAALVWGLSNLVESVGEALPDLPDLGGDHTDGMIAEAWAAKCRDTGDPYACKRARETAGDLPLGGGTGATP